MYTHEIYGLQKKSLVTPTTYQIRDLDRIVFCKLNLSANETIVHPFTNHALPSIVYKRLEKYLQERLELPNLKPIGDFDSPIFSFANCISIEQNRMQRTQSPLAYIYFIQYYDAGFINIFQNILSKSESFKFSLIHQ